MGQTALVSELEQAGAELLATLDSDARLSVEAAFWLYDGLTESWRLYVAASEVPIRGPLWAYGIVQETVRRQPASPIELADIAIVSPNEPIVGVLRSALQTGPGIYGIRFSRNSVGGVYIEDAYIYRLTSAGALSEGDETNKIGGFDGEVLSAHAYFEEREIAEPYWEVVVRPTRYSPERLSSPGHLKQVVNRAAVTLRGWDFPHIGRGEPRLRDRWVEAFTDALHHLEGFQFYLSGLFIWRRLLQEEREPTLPDGAVLFRGQIYSFTEEFQFAARLADQLMSDEVYVSIHARGIAGRTLWDDSDAVPPNMFTSSVDSFMWVRTLQAKELVAGWRNLSADASERFFQLFDFNSNAGEVIEFWQDKFLDKR